MLDTTLRPQMHWEQVYDARRGRFHPEMCWTVTAPAVRSEPAVPALPDADLRRRRCTRARGREGDEPDGQDGASDRGPPHARAPRPLGALRAIGTVRS